MWYTRQDTRFLYTWFWYFLKDDDSLKRNLDKEINNAEDDEYIDNPLLQNVNINSESHENIRNRLLLKRFTIRIIDLIFSWYW